MGFFFLIKKTALILYIISNDFFFHYYVLLGYEPFGISNDMHRGAYSIEIKNKK